MYHSCMLALQVGACPRQCCVHAVSVCDVSRCLPTHSAGWLPAGLMITSLVSYVSHSQVWALQKDCKLHVGGRTNRATVMFEEELSSILIALPKRDAVVPLRD